MSRSNLRLLVILGAIAAVVVYLVANDGKRIAGMSANDFASGAYLSILGVVLGASVLAASVRNLPAALKAAAFWVIGFAVLIGLYAYRDNFGAVGDRMLAELRPGRAIEVAGSGGHALMLARADDGHFYVDAEVDGEPVRFLVDTGASTIAFDRATASRLGFDTSDASFTGMVQTANGVARSAPVTVPLIRIGNIERNNVRAGVMDIGGDGVNLLGMSFLATLRSFEFQGSRLILTD